MFDLMFQLAARDIAGRYRGSWVGMGWMALSPIFLLLVYTFVFSVIFRARWPGLASGGGPSEFALIVLSGMLLHGFLGECLVRAPTLVLSNPNFVKKTVFPLEILAGVQLLSGLFHVLPTLGVLIVFQLILFGVPPASILLFPIVLVPVSLFALGFMWIIAALSVYFRDLNQVIGLFVTALFFLSPILYPITAVPESLHKFFYVNPLTFAIETLRGLMLWGDLPAAAAYVAYLGCAAVFAAVGYWFFRVLKPGFADAL